MRSRHAQFLHRFCAFLKKWPLGDDLCGAGKAQSLHLRYIANSDGYLGVHLDILERAFPRRLAKDDVLVIQYPRGSFRSDAGYAIGGSGGTEGRLPLYLRFHFFGYFCHSFHPCLELSIFLEH